MPLTNTTVKYVKAMFKITRSIAVNVTDVSIDLITTVNGSIIA